MTITEILAEGKRIEKDLGGPFKAQYKDIESEVKLETTASETVLRLYGPIAPYRGYVSAEAVAKELENLTNENLRIRIKSPGGSAFEGMAIYQQLMSYKGNIVTQVDGIAASAASLVYLAGEQREVPKSGALIMVHEAWTFIFDAVSKSQLKTRVAGIMAVLEAIDGEIVAIISERSNLSEEDAAKAIEATTWYRPKQAIKAGIATGYTKKRVGAGKKITNQNSIRAEFLSLGVPESMLDSEYEEEPHVDSSSNFLGRLRAEQLKKEIER